MKKTIGALIIFGLIFAAFDCKSSAVYTMHLVPEDEVRFAPATFLNVKESITEIRPHTSDSFIEIEPFVQMSLHTEETRKLVQLDKHDNQTKSEKKPYGELSVEENNLSSAKFEQYLGILRVSNTREFYIVDIFHCKRDNIKTYLTEEEPIMIADADLIIRSFVILDDLIFYAGVSFSKGAIIFCKKKYRKDEKDMAHVCYTIESEHKISNEEYDVVNVEVSAFKNKAGRSIVIIYVRDSRDENFQSTFFLFTNGEFRSLKIPVEEFIIGKIQIVNYNFDRDIINALVLNSKSGYSNLIHLRIFHGYLDIDTLRTGLVKSHVQNFDSNSQTIVIYEYDNSELRVRIQLLNISNMEYQTLYISKQKKIVKTEFAGNLVLIQTINIDYVNELYILDIGSKTLQKNKTVVIRMDDMWYLVADDRLHLLYVFKSDSQTIKVYELNTVLFDRFRVKMSIENKKGSVLYLRENEKLLNFMIAPSEFNVVSMPSTSDIIYNPRYEYLHKEDILGNNIVFDSPDMLYLDIVKVDFDLSQLNDCNISEFMFSDKYSIYICDNKKMILVNESFWKGLAMTDIRVKYIFNFRLFKTDDIVGYRFYFDDYLVILLKSGELRILKLEVIELNIPYEQKYHINTELVGHCLEINFTRQGLLCEEEQKFTFYSINVDNGRFFTERVAENQKDKVHKKNIYNSSIRSNNVLTLFKDPKTGIFSLIGYQKNSVDDIYSDFPFANYINDELEVKFLGFMSHLFILSKTKRLDLYVLHRYSYIKMPFDGFVDDYKDLIKIVSSQGEGSFFVIYRSTENKIKAIAYRVIFDTRKRISKIFVLDDNNCTNVVFGFKMHRKKGFGLYYSCADKESNTKLKVWEFLSHGPFIKLDKEKRFISLTVNKRELNYNLSPMLLTHKPELRFSDFLVKEKSDKNGFIELMLEKEKIIELKGAIRSITITPKIEGVEFIDRVSLVKEEELISDIPILKPDMRSEIEVVDENPVFNFGSYMYSQKRLEQNNNFFSCQKIIVTYTEMEFEDELRLLYLCRNRRTFIYYITNFSQVAIKLDKQYMEPNQNYEMPYLIKVKNFIYFFVTYSHSKVLRGLKIDYENSNPVLVFSYAYNLDPYPSRRSFPGTYIIFYQPSSNSIVLVVHNANSASIQFKKMSIQEFAFDVSSDYTLSFHESTSIRFDKIWFYTKRNKLGLLGVSNFYIYEIKLYQEGRWKYKIESKYINYLTDSDYEIIMDQNNDYFAMMNFRTEQRPNIYIFEKDRNRASNNLFYVIDRSNISTKNYHILDYAFVKKGTTKITSIVLIYLEQILRDGVTYKYLRSKQFEILQFKLIIRPQVLSYNQKITFEIEHLDQQDSKQMTEQYTIQLIINENLALFALKILTTVAACAFVALNITVCFVFSSNQKLQEDIDHIKQLQQQGGAAPILNNQE